MTATTTYATTAPDNRAVMSNAPPARMQSFETVATTSPVESRARTAGPARAAWCDDDLREAERRAKPVPDREPVPHHARDRLSRRRGRAGSASTERARRCRSRRSPPGSRGRSRTASAPAPASTRCRSRRRASSVGDLVPADPDEQPNRRPRVRRAGVAKRKLDQGSVGSMAVCGRRPRLDPSRANELSPRRQRDEDARPSLVVAVLRVVAVLLVGAALERRDPAHEQQEQR